MKNLILILALSTSIMPAAFSAATVGKIDMQKILLSIKQGKEVRKKLEAEFNKRKKELEKEEKKIRDEQASFQKKSSILKAEERENLKQKIDGKIIELQKMTMEYQKKIQEMEKKERGPIISRLKPIVEEISKQADVDMTFEVSSAPIVYAKKEVDLTPKVISAYDKKYK